MSALEQLLGADGADYQAQLDFKLFYDEGRRFFLLKGAGGNSFKNLQVAPMAIRAHDADVELGFYHFMLEPGSTDGDPVHEAENLYRAIIELWTGDGPICLDAETNFPSWYSGPPMTEWIQAFHARCKELFGILKLVLYTGTYFIDQWGIDALRLPDILLWLASWQDSLPAPTFWRQFAKPILWQNDSSQQVANLRPVDTDIFFGDITAFRALGRQQAPTDPWGYLRTPYGPFQQVVHPYFHGVYDLHTFGYPEGPAVGYTDNVIRQLFENGVWEANGRMQPKQAALGQAYFRQVGNIVDWPDVHPLLPDGYTISPGGVMVPSVIVGDKKEGN